MKGSLRSRIPFSRRPASSLLFRRSGLFPPAPAIYHAGVIRTLNQASRFLLAAVCLALPCLPSLAQSSSSPAPATQAPATQATNQPVNGTYVSTDPLAGVRYDNRWDVSVGAAFGHIHAGPNIRDGADLGGLDVSGSYWLKKRLGVEASGRGYLGTSGTTPIAAGIGESGVYVAQYMFLAGPEYLGPHNKHAAIIMHALVGGSYDDFNKEIDKTYPGKPVTGPAGPAGFFSNQFAFAGAFGGHIDLNRSAHWVFRVTPDALMTTYDPGSSAYTHTQWNFGISVGMQYKFNGKR